MTEKENAFQVESITVPSSASIHEKNAMKAFASVWQIKTGQDAFFQSEEVVFLLRYISETGLTVVVFFKQLEREQIITHFENHNLSCRNLCTETAGWNTQWALVWWPSGCHTWKTVQTGFTGRKWTFYQKNLKISENFYPTRHVDNFRGYRSEKNFFSITFLSFKITEKHINFIL